MAVLLNIKHCNNETIFPDLSWHRVRDNNEIQALLDTGNDYR